MSFSLYQMSAKFGNVGFLPPKEMEQRIQTARDRTETNRKARKTAIAKNLAEFQKENPLHDSTQGLVHRIAFFHQLMMSNYAPESNEDITRLPKEICLGAITHDLGCLTFAATLPKGMGDKELQKWARSSFALIDRKKTLVNEKESLRNLIWLVCRKIDLTITTMQAHVKTVQTELMKSYKDQYNDHTTTDIISARHKDHAKRGDIVAKEFSDLRTKLMARFGDADIPYKNSLQKDLRLQDKVAQRPEPEIIQLDMLAAELDRLLMDS